ncbi:hypothetical protein GCM10010149_25970 [Nonomuraea roseoviolacea subsp. roseoviolacea]|uniref:Chitinase n=1 Tax=Nonomuraea roseoviolacea subsp. carminata TaxID=160689 RepID=A0ABT1JU29_9ACTN|nr:hypothetical protein [Nonomuraea roseoviolacea]MCP2344314.1 hypothetical protein [Nonomuraea roseoviolacea subsp. carminata]
MSPRRLAAAALMAGALAAGAMAGPASAASAQVTEAWHLMGSYAYHGDCVKAGVKAISLGTALDFSCKPSGSRYDFYLYY